MNIWAKLKLLQKTMMPLFILWGNDFLLCAYSKIAKENIKCVASTTKRKVRVLPTGERAIDFDFVQFREYTNIK